MLSHQKKKKDNWEVMDMLIYLIVIIISKDTYIKTVHCIL